MEKESNGSLLDELLEPAQGGVPPFRDQIEVPVGHDELVGLELPTAFAAQTSAPHQAGISQDAQVLRNPLARETCTASQSRDGLGPALTYAGHQFETRRVPQRRKDRGRALEAGISAIRRHGFRRR